MNAQPLSSGKPKDSNITETYIEKSTLIRMFGLHDTMAATLGEYESAFELD